MSRIDRHLPGGELTRDTDGVFHYPGLECEGEHARYMTLPYGSSSSTTGFKNKWMAVIGEQTLYDFNAFVCAQA